MSFVPSFELPAANELVGLDAEQQRHAESLLDILREADSEVLLPGWLMRAGIVDVMRDRSPYYKRESIHENGFARVIGGTVCDSIGLATDDSKRSEVFEQISGVNGLGLLLDSINGWSYLNNYNLALIRPELVSEGGIGRAILGVDPSFIKRLHLLGTECAVSELGQLLRNNAQRGVQYADLEVFVGSPQGEEIIFDAEVAQDDLVLALDAYEMFDSAGHRPYDLEQLVGVVGTAARQYLAE